MRVRISWPKGSVEGELESTPTAKNLAAVLPVQSSAQLWGEEVYFSVPVAAKLEENAADVVDPGTICFWVEGNSLALPYGPTPASRGKECRLVTRVNVLGKIDGEASVLASVKPGNLIRIERVTRR